MFKLAYCYNLILPILVFFFVYIFITDTLYSAIKETLTYTSAVISSPALYEYPLSEGYIVAGCEPRTFSGIHLWKHEVWMLMT